MFLLYSLSAKELWTTKSSLFAVEFHWFWFLMAVLHLIWSCWFLISLCCSVFCIIFTIIVFCEPQLLFIRAAVTNRKERGRVFYFTLSWSFVFSSACLMEIWSLTKLWVGVNNAQQIYYNNMLWKLVSYVSWLISALIIWSAACF